MRKVVIIASFLVSLITLCFACIYTVKSNYQGNITINPDGSINPSTAPIQREGDLYILTDDLTGNLSVMKSNITLDGEGHNVRGEIGGISLKNVENTTVRNFVIRDGQYGLDLSECSYITVSNNTIMGTSFLIANEGLGGISVRGGTHNSIVGNRLENNFYGMYLTVADSTIRENNVVNNSVGIYLMDAVNNAFYHNSFINNDMHVRYRSQASSQLMNTWDNGSSSGGNYWSDYTGPDANNDGIGGSPYMIDNNNQDRYPLMKPWQHIGAPARISISSPENTVYTANNVPLNLSVDMSSSNLSYSLDGQANVTIAGNTTLSDVSAGLHNVTVYAWDAAGNVGASETVTFTVAELFPVVPVAIGVALVAVVIAATGSLLYNRKRCKEAQQT